MTQIHNTLRLLALMLCFAVLANLGIGVFADNQSPSAFRPEIVGDEDGDGNDLTEPPYSDILVLTPYRFREEMKQIYKIDNFDLAMEALTWEAAETALEEYMLPGMDPRKLTAVSVFYVHEKDDSKIIRLPAKLRITTQLTTKDYAELLAFRSRARDNVPDEEWEAGDPDHTGYVWLRIPSTLHEDGTLSFTCENYGSFALITYHSQESTDPTTPSSEPINPSKPTSPTTKPTTPGTGTPSSPQTGEASSRLLPALALLLTASAAGLLGYRKKR